MQHHDDNYLESPNLITDIVIGMSDGLTVPFALVAGLSSAIDSVDTVITVGLIGVAAGAIAMGLGGYLTGKTEIDHYHSELRKLHAEEEELHDKQKQKARDVFAEIGLSRQTRDIIAEEMAKDEEKWVDFRLKFGLALDKPDHRHARKSALNIGLSYAVGGMIPLAPYFFASTPADGLKWSCLITIICLFVFGFFKAKLTGQKPWTGAIRVTVIGSIAAGAAYLIAGLFR